MAANTLLQASEKYTLHDQTLWLSPERCIYWEEQRCVIVSDLHIGKTGHFRKSGIAVPQNIYQEDMQRLMDQLQYYKPVQLVVVGDLFHSKENKELDLFRKWRKDFKQLHIQLVKGNHDILKKEWYEEADISVSDSHLQIGSFCFIHDIEDACESPSVNYFFSGHIHPSVTLSGLGKQAVSLPCYYFTDTFAILPAFSRFTGSAAIRKRKADDVFAILPADRQRKQASIVVKV